MRRRPPIEAKIELSLTDVLWANAFDLSWRLLEFDCCDIRIGEQYYGSRAPPSFVASKLNPTKLRKVVRSESKSDFNVFCAKI